MIKTLLVIDVNKKIGSGHLNRCLNLVNSLKGLSEFEFVGEKKYFPKIKNKIYNTSLDEISIDIFDKELKFDLVIVDSYRFRKKILNFVKKISKKKLLIDDFISDYKNFNYILNNNPGISNLDYKNFKKDNLFTGNKFTLIDSKFKTIKKKVFNRLNIFLNCGLYDQKNILIPIIRKIKKVQNIIKFDCYIGLSKNSKNYIKVKKLTKKYKFLKLISNHKNYMRTIPKCNIAICPLGISVWERILSGMIVFTFTTDKRQKLVFKRILKKKYVYNFNFKNKNFTNLFKKKILNEKQLKIMNNKNRNIFQNNKKNLRFIFKKILNDE